MANLGAGPPMPAVIVEEGAAELLLSDDGSGERRESSPVAGETVTSVPEYIGEALMLRVL